LAVKAHQLFAFDILCPINHLLKAVVARPLLRIYAQYPLVDNKVWFDNFYTTITDSRLKYLIPMDKKTGIIMISYTDSDDVLSFLDENNKLKSEEEIIIIIEEEIRKLYSLEIPKPLKLKTCYWSEGCHYWRKNYDSDKISREIIIKISIRILENKLEEFCKLLNISDETLKDTKSTKDKKIKAITTYTNLTLMKEFKYIVATKN